MLLLPFNPLISTSKRTNSDLWVQSSQLNEILPQSLPRRILQNCWRRHERQLCNYLVRSHLLADEPHHFITHQVTSLLPYYVNPSQIYQPLCQKTYTNSTLNSPLSISRVTFNTESKYSREYDYRIIAASSLSGWVSSKSSDFAGATWKKKR